MTKGDEPGQFGCPVGRFLDCSGSRMGVVAHLLALVKLMKAEDGRENEECGEQVQMTRFFDLANVVEKLRQ
jgi:hypothetical protein